MAEVELVVTGRPGLEPAELDRLTRELAEALIQHARIQAVTAPATSTVAGAGSGGGTKSGAAAELGKLLLTGVFSASTVAAVAAVLRIWIVQRRAGTITVKRGADEWKVTGLTEADVRDALDQLPRFLGTTEPEP